MLAVLRVGEEILEAMGSEARNYCNVNRPRRGQTEAKNQGDLPPQPPKDGIFVFVVTISYIHRMQRPTYIRTVQDPRAANRGQEKRLAHSIS